MFSCLFLTRGIQEDNPHQNPHQNPHGSQRATGTSGSGFINPQQAKSGKQKRKASTGPSAQARAGTPPSGTGVGAASKAKEEKLQPKTKFVFSPAQKVVSHPELVWSQDWYALDDPEGAGAPEALAKWPGEAHRFYRSSLSRQLIMLRDIDGFESPFEAFGADEEHLSDYGEFITESDASVSHAGQELIQFEGEWQTGGQIRHVVALYAEPAAGRIRCAWIIDEGQSNYAELGAALMNRLACLWDSNDAQSEPSYFGILGQHALAFDLGAPAIPEQGLAAIEFSPRAQARKGDQDYFNSVYKANPQFKVSVVQSWMDEKSDVSLSYQIIQHDNGVGISTPFVQWLGGQFQHFHRDSKELGDFPVELIHSENTLTQVISSDQLQGHYERNKRAPEGGVILGVYLTRSPYARNVQTYWMSSTGEEPQFGYARMIGLRRYVRSRSEIIMRNSVAILIISGSDASNVERAAAALNPRSLPLTEELEFAR